MKRAAAFVLILTLALAVCLPAPAETAPVIDDEIHLFREDELAALTEKMEPLCAFGTPVLWVTRAAGEAEALCVQKYVSDIGYGRSGILFMINLNTRDLYLYVDGAIGDAISVSDCLDITDNVYREASGGYFMSCAANVFNQAGKLLNNERIARPMHYITSFLLAVCMALLITFVIVVRPGNKGIFQLKKRPKPDLHPSVSALPILAVPAITVRENKLIRSIRISSGGGSSGGGSYRSGGGHSSGGWHSSGGGHSGGGHGGGHKF